jgi:hypothetical protein
MDQDDATRDFDYLRLPLPDEPARRMTKPPGTSENVLLGQVVYVAVLGALQIVRLRWPGWPMFVALTTVVLGVAAVVVGVNWWRRSRRHAARLAEHPMEPWLREHDWDPRGVSVTPFVRFLRSFQSRWFVRLWLMAVAATLVGLVVGLAAWPALAALGAISCWGAWVAWRIHGAGTTHVSYAKFPFHPGETVKLSVGTSDGGATYRRADFHLRYYRSVAYSARDAARRLTPSFQRTVHRPPGLLPGPEQDVEIEFEVPADAPVTCLSASALSWWVLDIVANTSAGPYCESFLVPIYERPATEAAA